MNSNLQKLTKDELLKIIKKMKKDDLVQIIENKIGGGNSNIIKETKPQKIYTCGPNAAIKYIIQVAEKYNIQTEVALERDFACGTGVCMGCTVQIKENGKSVNKRICKDGPVFNGSEVLF